MVKLWFDTATHVVFNTDTSDPFGEGPAKWQTILGKVDMFRPDDSRGMYDVTSIQGDNYEVAEDDIIFLQRWERDGSRNIVPACAQCDRERCGANRTGYLAEGLTLADCTGFRTNCPPPTPVESDPDVEIPV